MATDPVARFQVRDAFALTGKGLVVTGDVLGGTVSVGMIAVLPESDGGPARFIIRGVEVASGRDKSGQLVGWPALLLDGTTDATVQAALKRVLVRGVVLEVMEAETA
jgi:translation elongation factor EF-Tu-like GTPase